MLQFSKNTESKWIYLYCSHKNLLLCIISDFRCFCIQKHFHKCHGKNIKRIEQVPEKPVIGKYPDASLNSQGNRPPTQLKQIRKEAEKRVEKSNRPYV